MRNFKLLLATTAILSTGLAANVLADDPAPVTEANYSNRASATLSTSIQIISPMTMTNGSISFPTITTTNMNNYESVKVKVNYDGTIDYANSTAQIISKSSYITPITIIGGDIGSLKSTFDGKTGDELASAIAYYNSGGSWAGGMYSLQVADTIPMYDNNTNTLCGEVSDLQKYWYYDTALDNNKGGFKVKFGGTFTVDSDYNPTGGLGRCSGGATVTFFTVAH